MVNDSYFSFYVIYILIIELNKKNTLKNIDYVS